MGGIFSECLPEAMIYPANRLCQLDNVLQLQSPLLWCFPEAVPRRLHPCTLIILSLANTTYYFYYILEICWERAEAHWPSGSFTLNLSQKLDSDEPQCGDQKLRCRPLDQHLYRAKSVHFGQVRDKAGQGVE